MDGHAGRKPRGALALLGSEFAGATQVKSPQTVQAYLAGATELLRFLEATEMPQDVRAIRREYLEAFIEAQLARNKPSTAATRYRDLQQLFR